MKCKICGAELRKEGDICKSCYEEYCEEEDLEKDVNNVYKLYRKYLPTYQLTRYFEWFLFIIFLIIVFVLQNQYLFVLLVLLAATIITMVHMALEKRKAVNTTCTFYDKKIVWKYKDKKKVLTYKNIKNICYYQNFFQKVFNLADIQFHPKGGTYLIGGFEIKNVPDFDDTWKEIQGIMDSKRKK